MATKNLFTKIILLLGLVTAGVQSAWADRYLYRLIKDNVEYGDLTFDVYNCELVGDGYSFKAPSYYLAVLKSIGGNADEVVSVLERHRNVLAVMQGHHHEGHRSERAGIHYYTFKAMIEGSYPEHNSYAIVNIDRQGNITIEGFADEKGSSLER